MKAKKTGLLPSFPTSYREMSYITLYSDAVAQEGFVFIQSRDVTVPLLAYYLLN